MSLLKDMRLPFSSRYPNAMKSVFDFIYRWDTGHQSSEVQNLIQSAWGNLNSSGGNHISPAPDLIPADPQWLEGIEKGIRPTVATLIERYGTITYDSCEGHHYPLGVNLQPAVRRVGLLPRNQDEWYALAIQITSVTNEANEIMQNLPIQVSVLRARLFSEDEPLQIWEVIDVEFIPKPFADWGAYFDALDEASGVLLKILTA